jgi:hypothetical protein
MSLMPSKLGAEPKKLVYLGVLVVIGVGAYLFNREPGDSGPSHPTVAPKGTAIQKEAARPSRPGGRNAELRSGRNAREYRPSMKPPKDVDLASVDPTLHLNALDQLQVVKFEGSTRSLFEISAAPPALIKDEPGKIVVAKKWDFVGPPAPPEPAPPPPTPRAPQIPLKYYGFVNPARPDIKRAFFMDGEDIIVAGEGDLIKKKYKVLRVGISSAEVEDTQFKGDNTKQTLQLEAEMSG